jgi:hypothetical protein
MMRWAERPPCSLVLMLALSLGGCGGGSAAAEKQRAAELEKRRAGLEEQLERLNQKLAKDPAGYEKARYTFAVLSAKTEEDFSELNQRVAKASTKAKKRNEALASEAMKTLQAEVDAGLAGLAKSTDQVSINGQLARLKSALDSFPEGLKPLRAMDFEKLRRRVAEVETIGRRCRQLLAKIDRMASLNRYEEAQGVLDSFDLVSHFKGSPFRQIMKQQRADIEVAAADWAKKKEEEDKIDWQSLLSRGEGLSNWTLSPAESFVAKRQFIDLVNKGDSIVKMECGDPAWVDYIVELEFQIVRGSGFVFGLRINPDSPDYDSVEFQGDKYGLLNWVRVRIEVKGPLCRVINLDSYDVEEHDLGQKNGRLGVVLVEKGLLRFRQIRVKVLKKA